MNLFRSIFGKKEKPEDTVKLLEPADFKDAISNQNVQLIDVRTPDEYEAGYIAEAQNIDFYSGKFNVDFSKLDKQKPVYVYCRSGSRSRQTAKKLCDMGFNEIYDLKGGFLNYK